MEATEQTDEWQLKVRFADREQKQITEFHTHFRNNGEDALVQLLSPTEPHSSTFSGTAYRSSERDAQCGQYDEAQKYRSKFVSMIYNHFGLSLHFYSITVNFHLAARFHHRITDPSTTPRQSPRRHRCFCPRKDPLSSDILQPHDPRDPRRHVSRLTDTAAALVKRHASRLQEASADMATAPREEQVPSQLDRSGFRTD